MSLPHLVAGERRLLFAGLVTTGAAQAGIAALTAAMISTAITGGLTAPVAATLAAGAVLAGAAGLPPPGQSPESRQQTGADAG
jgi:hypothetical protein